MKRPILSERDKKSIQYEYLMIKHLVKRKIGKSLIGKLAKQSIFIINKLTATL